MRLTRTMGRRLTPSMITVTAALAVLLALGFMLAQPVPALPNQPGEPAAATQETLIGATDSARTALAHADTIATHVLIAIDRHARDAKRVLGRLGNGYDIRGLPGTRLCVRNQRVLLEYRF